MIDARLGIGDLTSLPSSYIYFPSYCKKLILRELDKPLLQCLLLPGGASVEQAMQVLHCCCATPLG